MRRIVHIARQSGAEEPAYAIKDTTLQGDLTASAEASASLNRDQLGDWLAREGLPYSRVATVLAHLDDHQSADVELPPRIGPRIVRAWFDTVFNPLIESVEAEIGLLANRCWTFRYVPDSLERIKPVRQHLDPPARANLDQVVDLNAARSANVDAHDGAVEDLRRAAAAVHRALLNTREFTAMCSDLLSVDNLQRLGVEDVRDIFGAYSSSDRYNVIAEYVVNNTGILPPHYSTARLWNQHRDALLNCLRLPAVSEQYSSTIAIGQRLSNIDKSLVNQFKELRLQLSLRYDVPYFAGERKPLTA